MGILSHADPVHGLYKAQLRLLLSKRLCHWEHEILLRNHLT